MVLQCSAQRDDATWCHDGSALHHGDDAGDELRGGRRAAVVDVPAALHAAAARHRAYKHSHVTPSLASRHDANH